MAHPHKGAAHEASRAKFHRITGVKGGGHAHAGASHFKRPAKAHGGHESWHGHTKAWAESPGKVIGGVCKGRADRYARGGRTKGKGHHKKGDVNIAIISPHPQGPAGAPPMARPPMGAPAAGAPPVRPPMPTPAPAAMPTPGGSPLGAALPGMPRKSGGRALAAGGRAGKRDAKGDFIPGESNPENLRNWAAYASRNSYARGGGIGEGHRYPKMKAGVNSGVGRLESAQDEKRKGRRR